MKLVFLDSRENQIDEEAREGSLPTSSTWQFSRYIIDAESIPEVGEIAPAAMCAFFKDGSVRFCPAALKIPLKLHFRDLPAGSSAWEKAALTLAIKMFGATCDDKNAAEAKIAYWLKRGPEEKGFIRQATDDLPLRILHRWHYWQTDKFKAFMKSKKLTETAAKVETIKETGYKITLKEARLKTVCHRMFGQEKTGNNGEASA
jgi:hypothetical protein